VNVHVHVHTNTHPLLVYFCACLDESWYACPVQITDNGSHICSSQLTLQ